jgi:hypothetical protein
MAMWWFRRNVALEWLSVTVNFGIDSSSRVSFSRPPERCPFLALWMQQGAAKTRKERHKAKGKIERFSLGEMRNPAPS